VDLAECAPVIGYLIASARLAGPLDRLRVWLVDNNAVIMAVVLLVIGVAVIGKGIGGVLAGVKAGGKDSDVDMILVVG
jgi:hypothetical protein